MNLAERVAELNESEITTDMIATVEEPDSDSDKSALSGSFNAS